MYGGGEAVEAGEDGAPGHGGGARQQVHDAIIGAHKKVRTVFKSDHG